MKLMQCIHCQLGQHDALYFYCHHAINARGCRVNFMMSDVAVAGEKALNKNIATFLTYFLIVILHRPLTCANNVKKPIF